MTQEGTAMTPGCPRSYLSCLHFPFCHSRKFLAGIHPVGGVHGFPLSRE